MLRGPALLLYNTGGYACGQFAESNPRGERIVLTISDHPCAVGTAVNTEFHIKERHSPGLWSIPARCRVTGQLGDTYSYVTRLSGLVTILNSRTRRNHLTLTGRSWYIPCIRISPSNQVDNHWESSLLRLCWNIQQALTRIYCQTDCGRPPYCISDWSEIKTTWLCVSSILCHYKGICGRSGNQTIL